MDGAARLWLVGADATPLVRVFVQARMSSTRFPGKVLAPFRGRPMIGQVLASLERALPATTCVVLTSTDPSDDPLAAYVKTLDVEVFRGPLDDVFERFRQALTCLPAHWVLRISADSPLISARPLHAVLQRRDDERCDLVTTIFPRTFPKGQNVELIRASSLEALKNRALTADDREHVTQFFYRHPAQYRIINVESGDESLQAHNMAVDTVEDLQRLEQLSDGDVERLWSSAGRG